MNIRRPTLQRRRFIQSGSVLALGAASSVFAGRKLFSLPSRSAAEAPPLATAEFILDPEFPEPLIIDPGSEPAPESVPSRPLEHEAEYADFLASLDNGEPCAPTFRDALETAQVCDAVLASAKERAWKVV